jgi:hypothetical protein
MLHQQPSVPEQPGLNFSSSAVYPSHTRPTTSVYSFFDQCEEEFRRGLRKKNMDAILKQYEDDLLREQETNAVSSASSGNI